MGVFGLLYVLQLKLPSRPPPPPHVTANSRAFEPVLGDHLKNAKAQQGVLSGDQGKLSSGGRVSGSGRVESVGFWAWTLLPKPNLQPQGFEVG